ncbi:MAG: leucine-rich repeat domain-containing protein [Clostridia bacterium]|nr:leucine-rich repeat domain-containing protein [Clostridia bacterium]
MEFTIKKGVLLDADGCDEHVVIPEGVKEIGEEAFVRNTHVKRVAIPKGVTKINTGAFKGCTALEEIDVPASVTRIESRAFDGCKSLARVTLSRGLTTIGSFAFENCNALTQIEIPDTVTFLGNAFSGCTALRHVSLPEGLRYIDECAFSRCISLEEIVIPSGPESIGRYTFSGCYALKRVTIAEGVKRIWHEAFRECRELEWIVLPKSLDEMGQEVFSYYVHVTDNDDYDCYNGNECFVVPAIAYPKKIEDVKLPELAHPFSLARGFLLHPALYCGTVAADYLAFILRNSEKLEKEILALDAERATRIVERANPSRRALLSLERMAKAGGNEPLAALFAAAAEKKRTTR